MIYPEPREQFGRSTDPRSCRTRPHEHKQGQTRASWPPLCSDGRYITQETSLSIKSHLIIKHHHILTSAINSSKHLPTNSHQQISNHQPTKHLDNHALHHLDALWPRPCRLCLRSSDLRRQQVQLPSLPAIQARRLLHRRHHPARQQEHRLQRHHPRLKREAVLPHRLAPARPQQPSASRLQRRLQPRQNLLRPVHRLRRPS
jgi:hypothetical protein